MLSWLIFGISFQDILNFSLLIAIIIGVVVLLIKVPGSRMIVASLCVVLICCSGVYSGIKINEYYNAEGGIFGKIEDIIKPNKVEITNKITSIDFDFNQVVLTGSDDTLYKAEFHSDKSLKLDSNENYKVLVNGEPCKVIDYSNNHLTCTYNYSFYDVGNVYKLTDELTFTFGFNRYSTDMVVSTTGSSEAVALWNSYFDKNDFKVNVSTTADTYVSESNTATLSVVVDNEIVNKVIVPVGTEYTLTDLPEIEDKRFMGYSFDGKTLIEGNKVTIAFSQRIYGIYEDLNYVNFYNIKTPVNNYSQELVCRNGYIKGETLGTLTISEPRRANYKFLGWSTDGETVIDLSEVLVENAEAEYYAVWQVNALQVDVKLNAGESLTYNGVTYTSDFNFIQDFDEKIIFSNPTKENYEFTKYVIKFDTMNPKTLENASFNSSLDSLYYYDNSGNILIKEDLPYDLKDVSEIVISLRWNYLNYTSDPNLLTDQDLQLWIYPNLGMEDTAVGVYEDNFKTSNDEFIISIASAICGKAESEMDIETAKSVYVVAYSSHGVTEDMTSREILEKSYIYYWNEKHPLVQFMVDDVVYYSKNVEKNDYITLPEAPTKTGYTFLGWSTDGETLVENIETTAITESITYIAVFEKLPTYSFAIGDNNSDSTGKGLYSVFSSTNYTSSINNLSESTGSVSDFVSEKEVIEDTNVYALILPYNAGEYLSKIYILYTIPGSSQKTSTYILNFDQTTHMITFDGTSTSTGSLSSVYDNLEIFNCSYNENEFNFEDNTLNVNVNYSDYKKDYSYILLKFSNVKADIVVACQYVTQQYKIEFERLVITDDISSNSIESVATTYVTYGSKTYSTLFENYSDSVLRSYVLYENSISEENVVPDNILNNYITYASKYIYVYDLRDDFESKRIYFYTWNEELNHYEFNEISFNYYFQDYSFSCNKLDSADFLIVTNGLINTFNSDTGLYTWTVSEALSQTDFQVQFYEGGNYITSSSFPLTNEYSSIYSIRISEAPTIKANYNNLISNNKFGYVSLNDLISKINNSIGFNKYTETTILDVFNENVCWKIKSTELNENGETIANIEFIGSGDSELIGKEISISLLTSSTDITSDIFAISLFSENDQSSNIYVKE